MDKNPVKLTAKFNNKTTNSSGFAYGKPALFPEIKINLMMYPDLLFFQIRRRLGPDRSVIHQVLVNHVCYFIPVFRLCPYRFYQLLFPCH